MRFGIVSTASRNWVRVPRHFLPKAYRERVFCHRLVRGGECRVNGEGTYYLRASGDENNRWFRLHFCGRCGTTVMATVEVQPSRRLIMVGTLDDPNWVKLDRHIWTRSAQHWMIYRPDMNRFERTAGTGRTLSGGGKAVPSGRRRL